MAAGEERIRVRDVTLGYDARTPVLRHVDLTVRHGEVIALVGPSGAGKTTLVKAIAGLVRPLDGRIELLGATRPGAPPRGSVGYIPQRLGLVTHADVLDNVLLGAMHRMPSWRAALKAPGPVHRTEAVQILETVGLRDKADTPIKELSGGEQRRVAVARALLQRPRVLLADEFLAELDHRTARIVEEAVLRLAKDEGTAIVLVEHHVDAAARMANAVFSVAGGAVRPVTEDG